MTDQPSSSSSGNLLRNLLTTDSSDKKPNTSRELRPRSPPPLFPLPPPTPPVVGPLFLHMEPGYFRFLAGFLLPKEKVQGAISMVEGARKRAGIFPCSPHNAPNASPGTSNGSRARPLRTAATQVPLPAPLNLIPSTSGALDLRLIPKDFGLPKNMLPQIGVFQNMLGHENAETPAAPVQPVLTPAQGPILEVLASGVSVSSTNLSPTDSESSTPKSPLTLLTIPDINLQQIMSHLTVDEIFRLREVCTQFRDTLPIQIEYIKVHFCPIYSMIYITLFDDNQTVFQYRSQKGPDSPTHICKAREGEPLGKARPGALWKHVTDFLGGILANENITIAGIDLDFNTCQDKCSGMDTTPHVVQYVEKLQESMATRESLIGLENLTLFSMPQFLVARFVSYFTIREFEWNSYEVVNDFADLIKTETWKGMESITLGNAERMPPANSFLRTREVSLTLLHVSTDELWGMREIFSHSKTINRIEVFTQATEQEMLTRAFDGEEPEVNDFGKHCIWYFPIKDTLHTLFVNLKSSESHPEDQLTLERLS